MTKINIAHTGFILRILIGVVLLQMVLTGVLLFRIYMPTEAQLRAEHYATETATLVSPHSLREKIEHGENSYILIDVRTPEHYKFGHIIGAVNIPAGSDMIEKFKNLKKQNPNKEILMYCYTQVCMLGRKVGNELAKRGVSVRELGIGFHEWKHYWWNWNYEWEWQDIFIDKLIVTGEQPGEYVPDLETLFKGSGCSQEAGYDC